MKHTPLLALIPTGTAFELRFWNESAGVIDRVGPFKMNTNDTVAYMAHWTAEYEEWIVEHITTPTEPSKLPLADLLSIIGQNDTQIFAVTR